MLEHYTDESDPQYSERLVLEYYVPGMLALGATAVSRFFYEANEGLLESGLVATATYAVLNKALTKLDIYDVRNDKTTTQELDNRGEL